MHTNFHAYRQDDNGKEEVSDLDESYVNIFPKCEVHVEPLREISTPSPSQQTATTFRSTDLAIAEQIVAQQNGRKCQAN